MRCAAGSACSTLLGLQLRFRGQPAQTTQVVCPKNGTEYKKFFFLRLQMYPRKYTAPTAAT